MRFIPELPEVVDLGASAPSGSYLRFATRRPLYNLAAHVLIRRMVIQTFPAPYQAVAALWPLSMLVVRADDSVENVEEGKSKDGPLSTHRVIPHDGSGTACLQGSGDMDRIGHLEVVLCSDQRRLLQNGIGDAEKDYPGLLKEHVDQILIAARHDQTFGPREERRNESSTWDALGAINPAKGFSIVLRARPARNG